MYATLIVIVVVGTFGTASAVPIHSAVTPQAGVRYGVGDVFAGTGNGIIKHFSPTGVLLDQLDSGTGSSEETGMAFDPAGNLYSTQFTASRLARFDNAGHLTGVFTNNLLHSPESIVRDRNGDLYVGNQIGTPDLLKFDPNGNLLATFNPSPEHLGAAWVDLAADQCTLFYTSIGKLVRRFNVCTGTQLSDFATLPITGTIGPPGVEDAALALRVRPNGEVLVAASHVTFRLSPTGQIMHTYSLPGVAEMLALNLDPDQTSFWTADRGGGQIYKVDIDTGAVLATFPSAPATFLSGLAVFGEITAAQPKLSLSPESSTAHVGQSVTLTAQLAGATNPAGIPVTFTVTGAHPRTVTATTVANGTATFTYTGTHTGTDTVVATVNVNVPAGSGLITSNPATVAWTGRETTLKYIGDTSGDFHDPATLKAKLTDATGAPLAGQLVSIQLGLEPACNVLTGADGIAQCTVTPNIHTPTETAGTVPIIATFLGSGDLLSSSDVTNNFTVNREEDTLVLLNTNQPVANGAPVTLSAQLLEDGTTPIPNSFLEPVLVDLTLGSGASAQKCSGPTDIRGIVSCTIPSVNQPANADNRVDVTAVFPGSHFHVPATASASLPMELHGGRAFVFSATINLPSLVRQVVPTPDTGQVERADAGSVTPPCVTHTGALASIYADGLCANITTSVAPGTSTATSTIDHIAIAIPELPVVTATTVRATSTTTCTTATGATTITGLTVGGVAVNPNVAPNTTIPLSQSANLVVNEQVRLANGLTVNALHLIGKNGTIDVVVASSISDAQNCGVLTAGPANSGAGRPR